MKNSKTKAHATGLSGLASPLRAIAQIKRQIKNTEARCVRGRKLGTLKSNSRLEGLLLFQMTKMLVLKKC